MKRVLLKSSPCEREVVFSGVDGDHVLVNVFGDFSFTRRIYLPAGTRDLEHFFARLAKKSLQAWEGPEKYTSIEGCLLYTSPSPRDATLSRMPSSA